MTIWASSDGADWEKAGQLIEEGSPWENRFGAGVGLRDHLAVGARIVREGCGERIESALTELDEIHDAHVDPDNGVVEVTHRPDVYEGQIRDALRELGYHIEGHATGHEPHEQEGGHR